MLNERILMRRLFSLALPLVTLTLLAQTARADELDMKKQSNFWEIGAYGGMLFPPNAHEFYENDWPPLGTRRLKSVAPDFGLRVAYMPWSFLGVEVEGGLMPTSTEGGASTMLYTVRGHLLAQYPARFAPFIVVGGGMFGSSSDEEAMGSDIDSAFHWGLGLKWYAHPKLLLRLDGRHIVAPRIAPGGITSHFEVLLGISYVIGLETKPKDGDGDGVTDDKDKCPTEVGLAKYDGCPPPDSDNDGLNDEDDKCPKVAGTKAYNGCPTPDTDGDGVADDKDKCPKVKGETKWNGCPPPDSDGDGVIDPKDKCPKVKGEAKWNGCPPPDRDKDGIIDPNDKCPDQPETKNGYQDADGCPDKLPKKIKRFTGAIKGIYFATGRAKIRRRSFRLLDKAVKVLTQYKTLRLEITGHTDSRGKAALNQELSRKRAQAVKDYMVKKGVAGERLIAQGKGSDAPIASNKTRRGRAKNRRIEFKVIIK
jgi:outer membrane protein OmpA-like peptidoglycan-associated protein